MRRAASEISHWAEYDYVLVNDDIEHCLAEVEAIVAAERLQARAPAGPGRLRPRPGRAPTKPSRSRKRAAAQKSRAAIRERRDRFVVGAPLLDLPALVDA